MLNVGDRAPNFITVDDKGESVSLDSFNGKLLVLYFYPKDNTSGCTVQACDFRDNLQAFVDTGVQVVGISPDSVKSHSRFRDKHTLNFPLLVDEGATIAKLYGVWKEKSLYGVKYMGVERTTFVIDGEQKIAHIFARVKVKDHAFLVLNAIKEAASS